MECTFLALFTSGSVRRGCGDGSTVQEWRPGSRKVVSSNHNPVILVHFSGRPTENEEKMLFQKAVYTRFPTQTRTKYNKGMHEYIEASWIRPAGYQNHGGAKHWRAWRILGRMRS